ncbi:MAG TPA: glycosyltransferase [Bacteroidia bacterium]|jgi:hypothetical protein|nr:glycosyltransferase [Bacteroidia bacterium]
MSSRHLHIVALDVPYPPNYGAAVDMYYRIKSLSEAGINIILHCFDYGRGRHQQLSNICKQVYYYRRKSPITCAFSSEPYIVSSRRNRELFDRLFADEHPIWLEGVHTCACLTDERSKKKKIYVRMHNIEQDYYKHLADAAPMGFSKWYYNAEATRLVKYAPMLKNAACLFPLSLKDCKDLSAIYPNVEFLPPAIYSDVVQCYTGKGKYALYHGNLTVEENIKAARFVMDEVFKGLQIPLIVAGTGAAAFITAYPQTDLLKFIDAPTDEQLRDLISNAHINILPTFQATGIKLKLINSLFSGRFCLVNPQMVEGIGVEELCVIANDATSMKANVTELFQKDFPAEEITKRKNLLEKRYSNIKNAAHLAEIIFGMK